MFKNIRKKDFEECGVDEPKLHDESMRKIVRTMKKDGKKIIKIFNNGNETNKKMRNWEL